MPLRRGVPPGPSVVRTRSRRFSFPQKNTGLAKSVAGMGLERALELHCLRIGLVAQGEDDFDDEPVVLGLKIEGDELDQMAEPLLEGRFGSDARGFGQQIAVGPEDSAMDAATETRAIDAFTRRGEEDLLEQVADVPSEYRS